MSRPSCGKIHVDNAQPVEYGQVLFELEPLVRPTARRSLMFSRVLVANRGEIAVRVIRALPRARHRGGRRVLDRRRGRAARAPRRPRGAHRPAARGAELPVDRRRSSRAATTTGCEAVHPGYGFLSENAEFVRACEDNDLVFIGPPADVMERMGDKAQREGRDARGRRAARARARKARRRSRRRASRPTSSATRCC